MIDETIPTWSARHYYDRLGARHDWAERYEGRAKARALALLQLRPGLSVLNAGVGTGIDHRLIVRTVGAGGTAVGLDLSATMLDLAHCRTGSPVVQADVRRLPFRPSSFDRLLSAYVLDLLPGSDLPSVLSEFSRALKPNGRMVLVSLTEGVSPSAVP
jgi:ubiquinone/menaquinone biosynthesis C-methylase UbiE